MKKNMTVPDATIEKLIENWNRLDNSLYNVADWLYRRDREAEAHIHRIRKDAFEKIERVIAIANKANQG